MGRLGLLDSGPVMDPLTSIRVHEALDGYGPPNTADDTWHAVRDLLIDVMHHCDREGFRCDLPEAFEQAVVLYEIEKVKGAP